MKDAGSIGEMGQQALSFIAQIKSVAAVFLPTFFGMN
jgi:hypothetical protein